MASPSSSRLIVTCAGAAVIASLGGWFALKPTRPANTPKTSSPSGLQATSRTAPTALDKPVSNDTIRSGSEATDDSVSAGSKSPFTDDELAAEAKRRVAHSGPEALAWAEAQTDPTQRERFAAAVMRAWSEIDPRAAIGWLRQHDDYRESTWTAAFLGAAQQPALLLEIVRGFVAADPKDGEIKGSILLEALASAGQHASAADFARTAPPEFREDWVKAAFRRWSADKPEDAALAVSTLGSDPAHNFAFPALVEGWTEKSPSGLAAYALTLPQGDDRGFALGQAMLKWSEQDPTALASWLSNLKSRSEYDLGAMLLVTQSDRANRSTDLALRWTESISDPTLKRESLQSVVAEWLQTDPSAATAYVNSVAWLSPAEKIKVIQTAAPSTTEEP